MVWRETEGTRLCGDRAVWEKSVGRETTGQAISLDGCIINIAKKMGILEGMENDWSKYI